jgi:hypothetical protein
MANLSKFILLLKSSMSLKFTDILFYFNRIKRPFKTQIDLCDDFSHINLMNFISYLKILLFFFQLFYFDDISISVYCEVEYKL